MSNEYILLAEERRGFEVTVITSVQSERAAGRRSAGAQVFARLIGLAIFGVAALAATVLLAAASAVGPQVEVAPAEGVLFGFWSILYATAAPSGRVAVAAVALAALLASGVALVELRISNRSRRSVDARSDPLAPKLVMASNSGIFAGPGVRAGSRVEHRLAKPPTGHPGVWQAYRGWSAAGQTDTGDGLGGSAGWLFGIEFLGQLTLPATLTGHHRGGAAGCQRTARGPASG